MSQKHALPVTTPARPVTINSATPAKHANLETNSKTALVSKHVTIITLKKPQLTHYNVLNVMINVSNAKIHGLIV